MSDGPMPPPSEPTQVMPTTPSFPPTGPITGEVPVIPPTATGGGPVVPPPVPPTKRWYEEPGPRAAVIIVGVALLFLLIAGLIWWANDDDDGEIVIGSSSSSSSVASSTTPSSSVATTVPASTEPSSTAPASTEPTTSTSSSTTTTSTTTVAPTTVATTVAPTTVAPTTRPPTTTAAPTTVAATTSTTLPPPVVTQPADPNATLWDVISNTPDLSGVRELIELSGSEAEFQSDEPRTFLAPRNEALESFAGTPQGAAVLSNPNAVRQLLLDHLGAGANSASALFASDQFESLSDRVFLIDGTAQTIDGGRLVVRDINTANGVLHVLSKVLGT
jgi:uncharacterized surface protein with fasciclin (FAS1) repeats